MIYNDKLVYKVVIGGCLGIILWKEKEALTLTDILDTFLKVNWMHQSCINLWNQTMV